MPPSAPPPRSLGGLNRVHCWGDSVTPPAEWELAPFTSLRAEGIQQVTCQPGASFWLLWEDFEMVPIRMRIAMIDRTAPPIRGLFLDCLLAVSQFPSIICHRTLVRP